MTVDDCPNVSSPMGPGCYCATCLIAYSVSSVGPDPPSSVWVQRTAGHVMLQLHLRVEGFRSIMTPTGTSRRFQAWRVRVKTVVLRLPIKTRTSRVVRARIYLILEITAARLWTTTASRSTKCCVCRVERYRSDIYSLRHRRRIMMTRCSSAAPALT